ncbi:hypothetical protein DFS34DRAFT_598206 [Phlyctochytrium arcticum]|nr:hypothetical protein DFS34DRAFT_598206 [Phlyctochytrium arcticum]
MEESHDERKTSPSPLPFSSSNGSHYHHSGGPPPPSPRELQHHHGQQPHPRALPPPHRPHQQTPPPIVGSGAFGPPTSCPPGPPSSHSGFTRQPSGPPSNLHQYSHSGTYRPPPSNSHHSHHPPSQPPHESHQMPGHPPLLSASISSQYARHHDSPYPQNPSYRRSSPYGSSPAPYPNSLPPPARHSQFANPSHGHHYADLVHPHRGRRSSPAHLMDLEDLPLLKPPQLNNVQDISDIAWFSPVDGHPYVRIRLKTKGTLCRADYHDLSPKKQQELIERLRARRLARDDEGRAIPSTEEADMLSGLVAYMEKHRRSLQLPIKRGPGEDDEPNVPRKRPSVGVSSASGPSSHTAPPDLHHSSMASPLYPVESGNTSAFSHGLTTPISATHNGNSERLDESLRFMRDLHDTCSQLRQDNKNLRAEVSSLMRQLSSASGESTITPREHASNGGIAGHMNYRALNDSPLERALGRYLPSLGDRLVDMLRNIITDIQMDVSATLPATSTPRRLSDDSEPEHSGSRNDPTATLTGSLRHAQDHLEIPSATRTKKAPSNDEPPDGIHKLQTEESRTSVESSITDE